MKVQRILNIRILAHVCYKTLQNLLDSQSQNKLKSGLSHASVHK